MTAWRIHKTRIYLALAVWLGICATACEREPGVSAYDASTIEERYGLAGAYSDHVNTGNQTVDATIVPITLSDGRSAQLVIPRKQIEGQRVFLRDADGISPVVLDSSNRMTRDEFVRSQPRVVQRQTVTQPKKKRSWQKEALIIGGGTAAGAAIGAVAGGGKGAGVGAISGGVAGLIYDMATRNKK